MAWNIFTKKENQFNSSDLIKKKIKRRKKNFFPALLTHRMQKIWRLTTAAIKNFSLLQFEPVLVQKSLNTKKVTIMDNNSSASVTANASSAVSKTRISEMVKFLEVVGNLKVRPQLKVFFRYFFMHLSLTHLPNGSIVNRLYHEKV